MNNNILKASKELEIRFSEVDSMNVVWHGSYMLYFEDAREAFGAKYGLEYTTIFNNGCYAPLVDMEFHFRQPIRYGMKPRIDITYHPAESAKIIFDYEIRNNADETLIASGRSTQVFMDLNYNLMWEIPDFFKKWKQQHNV